MRLIRQALTAAIAITATAARAAPPVGRPDVATAKPIVACKLQTIAPKPQPMAIPNGAILYTGRPVDDPLANYERTSLGDWPALAEADRNDPWLRLVLLSRKRPVVMDLAILIDGKSFRDKRESWIDTLVSMKPSAPPQPAKKVAAKEKADPGNKKPKPAGTKQTVAASQNASPKTADAKADPKQTKPKPAPGISAQSRNVPTMRERLADYLATNHSTVSRREIRWLIAAWGAGPGVVMMDPSLSWQRSELAPLLTFLDRNGDGALSRDEIAQADAMLMRADVDANDVVDIGEIRREIKHPAFAPAVSGYPLVVVLDANTDWPALDSEMETIYGKHSASVSGAASNDARSLQSRAADISLKVSFSAADNDHPGISVLAAGPDVSQPAKAITGTTNVVTLDLGGDYVEFSAARGATTDETESAASQVAIGAVFDGNPLWRILDRDNDGRLTRRERQEMSGLFASLDRNGDGTVSASEIPIPIRFAVTLGPHVHELLASPTAAARASANRNAPPPAPAWFISMDKNNDGDVSRSEFLGTTEQFKQLDTNGDGLLSVSEALKLKSGK